MYSLIYILDLSCVKEDIHSSLISSSVKKKLMIIIRVKYVFSPYKYINFSF